MPKTKKLSQDAQNTDSLTIRKILLYKLHMLQQIFLYGIDEAKKYRNPADARYIEQLRNQDLNARITAIEQQIVAMRK